MNTAALPSLPADSPDGAAATVPATVRPASARSTTGCWKLAAGRALTLAPLQPGALHITHGSAWATLAGPHARREGDLFLAAPAVLPLKAGQSVVIEPLQRGESGDLAFDWVPALAAAPQRVAARVGAVQSLAQPSADFLRELAALGAALRGSGRAFVTLAGGVARLPLAFRPFASEREADKTLLTLGLRTFSADSSVGRAQGCIAPGASVASSGAL